MESNLTSFSLFFNIFFVIFPFCISACFGILFEYF
jgi:hypothetical protein